MKKIVWLTLAALGIPLMLSAQNVNDDLYFVPSKKNEVKTDKNEVKIKDKSQVSTDIIVKSSTPVVGKAEVIDESEYRIDDTSVVAPIDDVDAYNRRSSTYGNAEKTRENRSVAGTTTTRRTNKYDNDLEGEWVNGFTGSLDDYEYATRIIRFRNPRFAISISSPLYWDVVYGLSAWDWNIYVDNYYAYVFPTYVNRLWWDWRWNSFGWGWTTWGWPYYGWNWGWGGYYGWHSPWYYSSWGWGGWYDPYYSWGWHSGWGWHGGYYSGYRWGGSWGGYTYNNRRGDLGVGSTGRSVFGRSTRSVRSGVALDNNGRTGGRVVRSTTDGGNSRSISSSRVSRRADTGSGTSIETRQATTTRRSVGNTTTRNSSTGVNRTYSSSSDRLNNRMGGVSSGSGSSSRSTTTTTRSYGNSSSRSYSGGGASVGGGYSGGSTRSSGGGVSSGGSSGGGGGARRR